MSLKREDTTARIKANVEGAGLRRKRGPMKVRNIRVSDEDWQALGDHFRDRGIALTAGIRMILRDYMKREGIA